MPPSNDDGIPPTDSSVRLIVEDVSFQNSTAVIQFADIVARRTKHISDLTLGLITVPRDHGGGGGNDDDGTKRIAQEFGNMTSVEQLTLIYDCQIEHFRTVLDAGTGSVTELTVAIQCDHEEAATKLELLARFIQDAVQLNHITIQSRGSVSIYPDRRVCLSPHLIQTLDACTTITQIQVDRILIPDEVQQLYSQQIAKRNTELNHFVTDPVAYPVRELLALMSLFDNCPTGRYMLARRLPEAFSFAPIRV